MSLNATGDYRVDGGVAVITLANPPVNGLSHAVRSGIAAALERAEADPAVRIANGGPPWLLGADFPPQ